MTTNENKKPIKLKILNGLGGGLMWCAICWGLVECDRSEKTHEIELMKIEMQKQVEVEKSYE